VRITVADLLNTQHTDHVLPVCAVGEALAWRVRHRNLKRGRDDTCRHTHTVWGWKVLPAGMRRRVLGRNLSVFHWDIGQ